MMKRLLIFLVTGLAIVAANAPPADVTIGLSMLGRKTRMRDPSSLNKPASYPIPVEQML
jgi:hypothetical protein